MKLCSEQKRARKGADTLGRAVQSPCWRLSWWGASGALLSGRPGSQRTDRPGGPRTAETPPGGGLCRWWQPLVSRVTREAARLGQTLLCTAASFSLRPGLGGHNTCDALIPRGYCLKARWDTCSQRWDHSGVIRRG